ncbi:MAG: ATP-binding protein [Candidatus Helarchaeota archaeon]
MSIRDLIEVGELIGKTGTKNVQVKVINLILKKNDYVQVDNQDKSYLLIVKEIWMDKANTFAKCSVVGSAPRTPFRPKSKVFLANENLIRTTLGIFTSSEEGIYIGKLREYPYSVFLKIKKIGRVFITGKSGSGKSYTVGVLIEEILDKGIPIIIFDRHGEYSSLKVASESENDEFNVHPKSFLNQIIEFTDLSINKGGDVPIEFLLTSNMSDLIISNQCTIINLRGLDLEVQEYITKETLNRLYESSVSGQIQPFFCVIDEAHLFAGKKQTDTSEVLKLFSQEGRKFGANLIVVTQKPQLLDTTIRAQAGTWIIHQLTDVRDVDITIKSSEGLSSEWQDDIQDLDPGEAIITGDAIEKIPLIVKIRPRMTKHGGTGFNPLDFISEEEKESLEERKARLAECHSSLELDNARNLLNEIKSSRVVSNKKVKELEKEITELKIQLKNEKKKLQTAIRLLEKVKNIAKKQKVNIDDYL